MAHTANDSLPREFVSSDFRIRFDGCLVTTEFLIPAIWDLALAVEVVQAREEVTNGQTCYALIDGRNVNRMSSDARRYLASKEQGVKAAALLISSPVEKMIANFYLRIANPGVPTRCFTSKAAAVRWLREQDALEEEQIFHQAQYKAS